MHKDEQHHHVNTLLEVVENILIKILTSVASIKPFTTKIIKTFDLPQLLLQQGESAALSWVDTQKTDIRLNYRLILYRMDFDFTCWKVNENLRSELTACSDILPVFFYIWLIVTVWNSILPGAVLYEGQSQQLVNLTFASDFSYHFTVKWKSCF